MPCCSKRSRLQYSPSRDAAHRQGVGLAVRLDHVFHGRGLEVAPVVGILFTDLLQGDHLVFGDDGPRVRAGKIEEHIRLVARGKVAEHLALPALVREGGLVEHLHAGIFLHEFCDQLLVIHRRGVAPPEDRGGAQLDGAGGRALARGFGPRARAAGEQERGAKPGQEAKHTLNDHWLLLPARPGACHPSREAALRAAQTESGSGCTSCRRRCAAG